MLSFGGVHRLLGILFTTNPSQRTARGVGVGSSKQDVRRLVPGVHCHTMHGQAGADCIVLSLTKPRDTDFHVGANGVVDNIAVGVY